jgi:hypothetical protein
MNLQEMRDLVRTQLDLDDTDLPDTLLDAYIQEGYDRVLNLEQRWPFFEHRWIIDVPADGRAQMPVDSRFLEMLLGSNGRLLRPLSPRLSVMSFPLGLTPNGTPGFWSSYNRTLVISPPTGTASTVTAYGYRQGDAWLTAGASSNCDCDRRLHIPICWYACSLGYAQQEDEVLEITYLNRFKEASGQARDAIMRAAPATPRQFAYTHYPRIPDDLSGRLVLAPPGGGGGAGEDHEIIGGTP